MEHPLRLRSRAIERLKRHLVRTGMPRIQMAIIVLATGAVGFLCSVILLHLGVNRMAIRYPLAVGLAYLVFFVLLRVWLSYQRARLQGQRISADLLDIPDLDITAVRGSGDAVEPIHFGGGSSGGGGAGGHFGPADAPDVSEVPASTVAETGGDAVSCIPGDLDEAWILAIPLLAATAALIASLYVVYSAPALFAELLLDGALVTGLYRRLRGLDHRHWVAGAIRHTWIPVLIVALVFLAAGSLMEWLVPAVRSLGDVWRHLTAS
jgi:hypothetical protein